VIQVRFLGIFACHWIGSRRRCLLACVKYRLVAKFLIGSLEMYSVISGSFFGSN